jgi:hypothetical protein
MRVNREFLRKAALDVRLPEQFSIIGKLRALHPSTGFEAMCSGSSQQLQILEKPS